MWVSGRADKRRELLRDGVFDSTIQSNVADARYTDQAVEFTWTKLINNKIASPNAATFS